jgi:hypothetical protein
VSVELPKFCGFYTADIVGTITAVVGTSAAVVGTRAAVVGTITGELLIVIVCVCSRALLSRQ